MNSTELREAIRAALTDRCLSGEFCDSLLKSLMNIGIHYGQEKYEEGYAHGHRRATDYSLMLERQLNEEIADLKNTYYDEELGFHDGGELEQELLRRVRS